MSDFTDRNAEILHLWRSSNLTQQQIAKRFGVSRTRIAMLIAKAGLSGLRKSTPEQVAENRLRRYARRREWLREATLSMQAAEIDHANDGISAEEFERLRAQIPADDIRDLTGQLLGDPWPNDRRRRWRRWVYPDCDRLSHIAL